MEIRKRKFILMVVVGLFLIPSLVFAQTVRVAAIEFANSIELQSDGSYTGYSISYLEDIAAITGWEYEYVPCTPAGAFAALEDGTVDIMPLMYWFEERDLVYAFSEHAYGTTPLTLFVNSEGSITEENLTEKPMTIAYAEGTKHGELFEEYALQRGLKDYTLTTYPTLGDCIQAVEDGNVDGGVVSGYYETAKTKPLARFSPAPYYFSTRIDNTELMAQLNDAIAQLLEFDPTHDDKLYAEFNPELASVLMLTPEEMEYVQNHSTVRVASRPFSAPLLDIDNDGVVTGILPDLLALALKRAGIEAEFVPSLAADSTSLERIKAADAQMSCYYMSNAAQAKEDGLILSDEYMVFSLFSIRKEENGVTGEASKYYATTTIPAGKTIPGTEGMEAVIYDTPRECFEALRTGKVSVAFVNAYSAGLLIREPEYSSFSRTMMQGYEMEASVAFPKGTDPLLVSIVNKTLATLTASQKNEVVFTNTLSTNQTGIREFIQQNPFTAIVILIVFFLLIIITGLYIISLQRRREGRKANEELKKAMEIANKANAAKGEFMSRMSHEIRTPLNALIGFNTLAKTAITEAKDDHKRRQATMDVLDCLYKSELASRSLLAVVNDVLDMAAIESGKIKIARERFDFRSLITSLTVVFYAQAKSKDITLDVIFTSTAKDWYVGDQMRINQILTNLMSNALKFTPAGGKVSLSIKSEKADDSHDLLTFTVSDTGIGMEAEFLKHLWVPFEQADSSISRRFGGTGLGLSITKNLADLMGGSINVVSTLGRGSTFHVELPLENTKQEDNKSLERFEKLRALVIDDDRSTCDYIKVLFDRCHVTCQCFTDPVEGLREFASNQGTDHEFNLCLIDWKMPKMDGIETIREIRKIAGDEIKIIVITAYDYSEISGFVDELGITTFIAKPLFQSSLFDMLSNVCGVPVEEKKAEHVIRDFTGVNILLAEDNKMNMEIARRILIKRGIMVDCAWNGKEALEMFEKSPRGTYDVILMDIHMPEMDGHEATKRIRSSSHPQAKEIPIIAMTADAFVEDVTEALSSGMNDHIAKPIDIDLLFRVLEKHLKKH